MAKKFYRVGDGIRFFPQTSAPSDPENGDMYYDDTLTIFRFRENGAWVALGGGNRGLVSVQIFTASGTWNKPLGIRHVVVELAGGGGGSGGTAATGPGQSSASDGGGGGGYSKKFIDVSAISSVTVTIGAGGTAGTAGVNNGGAGGTTSFGAHCSATGGAGGAGGAVQATDGFNGAGSNGGTGTGGDLNLDGGAGQAGFFSTSANDCLGGIGGGNKLAPPNRHGGINSSGIAGKLYGGGASGASNNANNGSRAGSAGEDGIVIVWEYA